MTCGGTSATLAAANFSGLVFDRAAMFVQGVAGPFAVLVERVGESVYALAVMFGEGEEVGFLGVGADLVLSFRLAALPISRQSRNDETGEQGSNADPPINPDYIHALPALR